MADDPKEEKKKGGWNKKGGSEEETAEKKKPAASQKKEENPDFKYIVRVANTDLDGKFQVIPAIAMVKGLGIRTAAIVAERAGVNAYQKIGNLKDDEVARIADAVEGIEESLPAWMLNRRKDIDTGDNMHLIGTDVEIKVRDDLNRLKKIRTYRGLRHEGGQKVRGQRSKSNGRTGLTLGVQKQKQAQPANKEG